jgi:hypothetical protein
MAAIRTRLNLWIAVGLILANLFTWARLLLNVTNPHIVQPIMDAEVKALLDYIRSGKHSGEMWQVTLTELEAEQTITWYLNKYPQIPFAYPQVTMTPDSISGQGDVILTGLRFHVSGKAHITLQDGLPVVKILDMNLPLPPSMKARIEAEIQKQLKRAELLPVRFTSAEWKDGEVIVKGVIR